MILVDRVVKRGRLVWNRFGLLLTRSVTVIIGLRDGYKLGQQYRLVEL